MRNEMNKLNDANETLPALSEAEAARYESLVGEALSADALKDVPETLVRDVLAGMRAAKLEPLVAEAMAAEEPPADLALSIFAATRRKLARRHENIIARIGPVWRVAIAASWAAAIGLASWLHLGPYGQVDGISRRSARVVESRVAQLAGYTANATPLDHELKSLAARIDQIGDPAARDWDAVGRTLDRASVDWEPEIDPLDDLIDI